jgi:heptaprenyl diphosphate synthase
VNASVPLARRRNTLSSSLGLGEKLFASSDERRFVREIEDGLDVVEEGLLVEMSFADDMADVTSRYLLEAGGKRVRPLLTLLAAQLGDGNGERVYAAAKAIEITHLASLYHDDVMDESQMRRGVPTAQTVWGNSVAILTGDLLFARASKLVASLGERVIQLQADTFERLCLGQLHETIGPRDGEDVIAHYIQVLADKTGSLISAAAEIGVVCSGAPEEYRLPVVGGAETGKVPGTDLRAGVSTLPLLYLRELATADEAAAALLARIDRDVSALTDGAEGDEADADLADAIAELRGHQVTSRTLAEAHRWAREAVAALAPLPDGPVKKSLTRFADTVVERSN